MCIRDRLIADALARSNVRLNVNQFPDLIRLLFAGGLDGDGKLDVLGAVSYTHLPPIGTEGSTSVFSDVKNAISTRQAAELYGFAVNRNGMMCCPFHGDKHLSLIHISHFRKGGFQ